MADGVKKAGGTYCLGCLSFQPTPQGPYAGPPLPHRRLCLPGLHYGNLMGGHIDSDLLRMANANTARLHRHVDRAERRAVGEKGVSSSTLPGSAAIERAQAERRRVRDAKERDKVRRLDAYVKQMDREWGR